MLILHHNFFDYITGKYGYHPKNRTRFPLLVHLVRKKGPSLPHVSLKKVTILQNRHTYQLHHHTHLNLDIHLYPLVLLEKRLKNQLKKETHFYLDSFQQELKRVETLLVLQSNNRLQFAPVSIRQTSSMYFGTLNKEIELTLKKENKWPFSSMVSYPAPDIMHRLSEPPGNKADKSPAIKYEHHQFSEKETGIILSKSLNTHRDYQREQKITAAAPPIEKKEQPLAVEAKDTSGSDTRPLTLHSLRSISGTYMLLPTLHRHMRIIKPVAKTLINSNETKTSAEHQQTIKIVEASGRTSYAGPYVEPVKMTFNNQNKPGKSRDRTREKPTDTTSPRELSTGTTSQGSSSMKTVSTFHYLKPLQVSMEEMKTSVSTLQKKLVEIQETRKHDMSGKINLDINLLSDQVCRVLERKIRTERERRGW